MEKIVEGDVYWDRVMRALYSTDASIYEVMPLAVVFPKNVGDVINVVKYGYRNGVSIHARGAGSSLAGQAIGSGIILDFTKYMNRIIEMNVEENYVWVEPGIVMEKLNEVLEKYGKFFPPDPASSHFCTIGGMIGNNASGMRSVKYGNTIDYVEELKVVLSNGDIIHTKPINVDSIEFKEKLGLNTFEGKIYREIYKLFIDNRNIIEKSMPKVEKNASGYRIEYLLRNNVFNLSKIFVGSEGTLGIIVAAKLRIVDLPGKRGLLLAFFDSLEKATNSILTLLKYKPSALEIMDKKYIDLVRDHYEYMRERIPGKTESILIIEFEGENEDELKERLDIAKNVLTKQLGTAFNVEIALTEDEMENLFEVRRAAIPIINKTRGLRKYPAFIEDLVVPPDRLLEFIRGMYRILEKYGLDTIIFGHAGQGNIHTHPPINLKDPIDIDRMRAVCRDIYRLVVKLRGAISGEHGNGRLRTPFMKIEYPELLKIFVKVKEIFDPKNILNPGPKINYDDYY
ncbi:MAG TPA: FAD-binding oxidoreductase, partial [Thermoprotei archaeon]|nr:FAD-binding oxidoreductase [Thermoprotei archaeon]